MNDTTTRVFEQGHDDFAQITAPATVRIARTLPGPIDRVWRYLTDGELRRQWLAAGEMTLVPDAPFELVWRNDELSDPPGKRPEEFDEEMRMASRVIEADPPRRLVFAWGEGEVAIDLETRGDDVLLTVLHSAISDRRNTVMIGAGWHRHLDILSARLRGDAPGPFWEGWVRLRDEYEQRVP